MTAARTERYGFFFSFIRFDVLWEGITQGAFCTASTENFNKNRMDSQFLKSLSPALSSF